MEDTFDEVEAQLPSAPRAVSGTLYAPGTFPRSTPAAPPIYRTQGGIRRPQNVIDIDIRLRAAMTSSELLRIVAEAISRFDIGNVVIAFTCAAKLDNGQEMATLDTIPAWSMLQEQLLACADKLEPRGMSMVAYAAARLMWGNEALLAALAHAGARRSCDFGPTDVAKGCWAFSKLRFVSEPAASVFWRAMSQEAPRVVRSGRFVDVSMMAWAFAITDHANQALFDEVASATRIACDTLSSRSLAGISWSFAKVQFGDRKLFADIRKRAAAIVPEFSAHDISAFCWAFAALGERDVHLFEALAAHAVEAKSIPSLAPSLAAELAWGYAAADVRHDDLFEELEKLCAARIDDLETEDVAGFAWSFMALGRSRGSQAMLAISEYARRFAGRLRPGERNLLAWALECDVPVMRT